MAPKPNKDIGAAINAIDQYMKNVPGYKVTQKGFWLPETIAQKTQGAIETILQNYGVDSYTIINSEKGKEYFLAPPLGNQSISRRSFFKEAGRRLAGTALDVGGTAGLSYLALRYGLQWYFEEDKERRIDNTNNKLRLGEEKKELKEVEEAIGIQSTTLTTRKEAVREIIKFNQDLLSKPATELDKIITDLDGFVEKIGKDNLKIIKDSGLLPTDFDLATARENAKNSTQNGERVLDYSLRTELFRDLVESYLTRLNAYEWNKEIFRANVEARKAIIEPYGDRLLRSLLPDAVIDAQKANRSYQTIRDKIKVANIGRWIKGEQALECPTPEDYKDAVKKLSQLAGLKDNKAYNTLEEAINRTQVNLQDTIRSAIDYQKALIEVYAKKFKEAKTKEERETCKKQLSEILSTTLIGEALHKELMDCHAQYIEQKNGRFVPCFEHEKDGSLKYNGKFMELYEQGIQLKNYFDTQQKQMTLKYTPVNDTVAKTMGTAKEQVEKEIKIEQEHSWRFKAYHIAGLAAAGLTGIYRLMARASRGFK